MKIISNTQTEFSEAKIQQNYDNTRNRSNEMQMTFT